MCFEFSVDQDARSAWYYVSFVRRASSVRQWNETVSVVCVHLGQQQPHGLTPPLPPNISVSACVLLLYIVWFNALFRHTVDVCVCVCADSFWYLLLDVSRAIDAPKHHHYRRQAPIRRWRRTKTVNTFAKAFRVKTTSCNGWWCAYDRCYMCVMWWCVLQYICGLGSSAGSISSSRTQCMEEWFLVNRDETQQRSVWLWFMTRSKSVEGNSLIQMMFKDRFGNNDDGLFSLNATLMEIQLHCGKYNVGNWICSWPFRFFYTYSNNHLS